MENVTTRKHSVALAIRSEARPGKVLFVRRPDDDAEFPGMWGLPAASCRLGETHEDAALRVGDQKLGARLVLGERLARGRQRRGEYLLLMSLYEARLEEGEPQLQTAGESEGVTLYTDWRWGNPDELLESAAQGSLCSQLLLENRH